MIGIDRHWALIGGNLSFSEIHNPSDNPCHTQAGDSASPDPSSVTLQSTQIIQLNDPAASIISIATDEGNFTTLSVT